MGGAEVDGLADPGVVRNRTVDQVEAAVLDRTRTQRRKFRRLAEDEVAGLLG